MQQQPQQATHTTSQICLTAVLKDSFVSCCILQHLTLQELAACSVTSRLLREACRSNALWKTLLDQRWNVSSMLQTKDDESHNFLEIYQRAHLHPHDLWVFHENCVPPWDGIVPAACCRIGSSWSKEANEGGSKTKRRGCCVCCRTPQRTQQVAAVSQAEQTHENVRHQHQHRLQQEQAFATAATFHRKLSLDQYRSTASPGYLTDLLFFNLTDPATAEGERELQALLQASRAQLEGNHNNNSNNSNNVSSSSVSLLETTHHSWHQIRLVNPDWDRPLVFSFGVQRSDCFAVYPSQGHLKPGESVNVTVSVRPLGSALAYAFERLNIERDALDSDWSSLYSREAHLPMCPFVIKYRFCNRPPGRQRHAALSSTSMLTRTANGGDNDDDEEEEEDGTLRRDERVTQSTANELEHFWKQSMHSTEFRAVYLSAHVHAHYNFWDFYQQVSFDGAADLSTSQPTALMLAPNLQLVYPQIYEKAKRRLFQEKVERSCCSDCGHKMTIHTPSESVMGAAQEWASHVELREQRRRLIARNIRLILDTLVTTVGDGQNNSKQLKIPSESTALLLSAIWAVVQTDKATPWVTSREQLQSLSDLEQVLDDLYQQIPVGGEIWHPWRRSKLYRARTSTSSIYGSDEDATNVFCNTNHGQDEPLYLETFRNLAHNPGNLCIGRQDDPNHIFDWIHVDSRKSRGKYAKNLTTFHRTGDSFMNDPISSFQVGMALMQDPRCLLVHGLYDRIPYPGAVIRRPKQLLKRRTVTGTGTMSCQMHRKEDDRLYLEYGILRFIHGAPPSGIGRFPLTKFGFATGGEGGGESVLSIVELDLGGKDDAPTISKLSYNAPSPAPPQQQPNRRGEVMNQQQPAALVGRAGPRLFQLLWVLGAQAGLIIIDDRESPAIFVERSILIASQWISLSLSLGPLLCILMARGFRLIQTRPTDYYLDRLPFELSDEMRWLTSRECCYVSLLVLFAWMVLARWSERHVGRGFDRVMVEHVRPKKSVQWWLWDRMLRIWDATCPLFLQRRIFEPYWNQRTTADLNRLIGLWRSNDVHISDRVVRARVGIKEGNKHGALLRLGKTSVACKVLVGAVVVLGSFCSTSPHFWLNAVSIFSCSISLGLSVSTHALERGRINISVRNTSTGSFLKELNLVTVAILALLVGQLVGSSGGTMFLAEFIVTSISLILGGAGTVSASSMESWIGFFGLSCVSFWGYLFGRIGLCDGVRQKQAGYASILLSNAVLLIFAFWVLIFLLGTFESHVGLVIARWPDDSSKSSGHSHGYYMARIQ